MLNTNAWCCSLCNRRPDKSIKKLLRYTEACTQGLSAVKIKIGAVNLRLQQRENARARPISQAANRKNGDIEEVYADP